MPPPIPVSAATARKVAYEVPGFITTKAATVGTSRVSALNTVQFRPPNRATAKVYGTRTRAPTSVAVEIRKNLPAGSTPYSGPMNRTITDHRVQTEKPMCSDRTENQRLRRAIRSPLVRQKVSSSGSHCSIQRPAITRLHGGLGGVVPNLGSARFGAVPRGDLWATLLSPGRGRPGETGGQCRARGLPVPLGQSLGRRLAATSSTQPTETIISPVSGQMRMRASVLYEASM